MFAIVLGLQWLGRVLLTKYLKQTAIALLIVVTMWDAVLLVLDKLVAWIVAPVVVFIFQRVLDVLFWFISTLLVILPLAPESPFNDLPGMVSQFMWLNRYVPLAELLNLFAFIVTAAGFMTVWKLVKFIRGAG